MLEVVEGEHGPALRALYVKKTARGRGRALERDEPLDRRQQACHARAKFKFALLFLSRGEEKVRTPYTPESARVPNDAGQFRELRGQRVRRFDA